MLLLDGLGRLLDCSDDAWMRAAATNIALQGLQDLRQAGIRVPAQQANTAHDHSRCAVSTLESTGIEKSLLHGMELAVLLQPFNGGDWLSGHRAYGSLAGAPGQRTHQHGASAALPFAAAILGACEAQLVAQHGEQRSIGRVLDGILLAVDFENHSPPSFDAPARLGGYGANPGMLLNSTWGWLTREE